MIKRESYLSKGKLVLKNMHRTLKNILFLVSLSLLSLQPIFCAKAANSYILKTDLDANAKNVDEFRKDLGGQLKKEIYRVIDQYPALKKKYKRSPQGQPKNPDEISVYPVQPHFTVLMLGDIALTTQQQACVTQSVQTFLDILNAQLSAKKLTITNALPLEFIPGQQADKEVSYIGIDLTKILGKELEPLIKHLHDVIEKRCGLKLSHYKAYQKHQWFPHITLFRINARNVLQTMDATTEQTLLENIQQILAQKRAVIPLGNLDLSKVDLYNGKTLIKKFETTPSQMPQKPAAGAYAVAAGAGAGAYRANIKEDTDQGKPKATQVTKTLAEFQEAFTDYEICSSRENAKYGKIVWDVYHALNATDKLEADKLMVSTTIQNFAQYR